MSDAKRAPHNPNETAATQMGHMMGMLGDAMGGTGAAAAAVNAERAGQASFVNSTTLPTEMSQDAKKVLEEAGVKFLGAVPGDELFQYVELPAGWKKRSTDHSMHNNLLDDKGRVRATIFYKAAFYDRSASLSVSRRYSTRFDYQRFEREGVGVSQVLDGATVLHATEPVARRAGEESWHVSEKSNKLAREWLLMNFPVCDDPGAYWD